LTQTQIATNKKTRNIKKERVKKEKKKRKNAPYTPNEIKRLTA
jgi:hypothetical protein